MLIREFSVEDSILIDALAVRAWSQYKSFYPNWETTKVAINQMSKLSTIGQIFVAEHNKIIVGAVGYISPNGPRAEYFKAEWGLIRMLVVAPESRGKGIGTKLTQKCLNVALEDNVPTVALHTNEMMEAALSIYLKLGFYRVGYAPSPTSTPFGIYCLDISEANKH